MEEFKNCDTVLLKSGSPRMTIKGIDDERNEGLCQRFIEGNFNDGWFNIKSLEKVDE